MNCISKRLRPASFLVATFATMAASACVPSSLDGDASFQGTAASAAALSFPLLALWTPNPSDRVLFTHATAGYELSFRLVDFNRDGYFDACIEHDDGIHCGLNQLSPHLLNSPRIPEFAKPIPTFFGCSGCTNSSSGVTGFEPGIIQFADIDGDPFPDPCGRTWRGIECARGKTSRQASSGQYEPLRFEAFMVMSTYSKTPLGASPVEQQYRRPVQFGDLNGDGLSDVCVREASGVICELSTRCTDPSCLNSLGSDGGYRFVPAPSFFVAFADSGGWGQPQYARTMQLGDIDGDGKADLCLRGAAGILCALSTGSGFLSPQIVTNAFSDAGGWNASAAYYASIRLVDYDEDGKADICGRSALGIFCTRSRGVVDPESKRVEFYPGQWIVPGAFSDVTGWNPEQYGATIQFAKLQPGPGLFVCGRGPEGIVCSSISSSVTVVNNDDPSIVYANGSFGRSSNRWVGDVNNDIEYTTVNGATAQLRFDGTGVGFLTERAANAGMVDVFIDDVFLGTVDCYAAYQIGNQEVFLKTNLPYGSHTIKVKKTTGQYMQIDGFRVH